MSSGLESLAVNQRLELGGMPLHTSFHKVRNPNTPLTGCFGRVLKWFRPAPQNSEPLNCPTCFEPIGEQDERIGNCAAHRTRNQDRESNENRYVHYFHTRCIEEWRANKGDAFHCPLCRIQMANRLPLDNRPREYKLSASRREKAKAILDFAIDFKHQFFWGLGTTAATYALKQSLGLKIPLALATFLALDNPTPTSSQAASLISLGAAAAGVAAEITSELFPKILEAYQSKGLMQAITAGSDLQVILLAFFSMAAISMSFIGNNFAAIKLKRQNAGETNWLKIIAANAITAGISSFCHGGGLHTCGALGALSAFTVLRD